MKQVIGCLILVSSIYSSQPCNGQDKKLPRTLVDFFVGKWSGSGAFSNGRKISADLEFEIVLDSSWLIYKHKDHLPNTYEALSMWGIDKSDGQFVAFIFDRNQGQTKFMGEGWKEEKLVLSASGISSKGEPVLRHFIYEKISEHSFRMTYETSKDGIKWSLIDSLVFNKIN